MSIFGPADTLDAAITTYVDQQDALRVLKSGDAMSGNLAMGGNLVSGLPEAYPPAYSGDEAISWAQVVALVLDSTTNLTDPQNPQDIATKAYVDSRTD